MINLKKALQQLEKRRCLKKQQDFKKALFIENIKKSEEKNKSYKINMILENKVEPCSLI